MQRILPLVALLSLVSFSAQSQTEKKPFIDLPDVGFISSDTPRRYHLMFDFGIEQWENGKKATHRLQLWDLTCEYPPSWYWQKKNQTHCALRRTVIDRWDLTRMGIKAIVTEHRHDTDDGTLELKTVDWKRGILDLAVVYSLDQTKTEVEIRLKYVGDSILLDSFRAFAIARSLFPDGKMSVIEYRIPEYTYTMEVPIQIRGYKSEEQKDYEDMLGSLGEKDRAIWMGLVSSPEEVLFASFSEETFRRALPDYDDMVAEKRNFTADDWSKIRQAVLDETGKKLERSGLSEDGQKKVLFFLSEVLESWYP